jgi:hypothetical protein
LVRTPARPRLRYTVLYEGGGTSRTALALGHPATEAEAEITVRLAIAPYFGGCSIMRVFLIADGAPTDMFVLEFAQDRTVNKKATRLYRATRALAYPDADRAKMPAICGPAVLFDRPIWPRA